jgi:hypothetical protein
VTTAHACETIFAALNGEQFGLKTCPTTPPIGTSAFPPAICALSVPMATVVIRPFVVERKIVAPAITCCPETLGVNVMLPVVVSMVAAMGLVSGWHGMATVLGQHWPLRLAIVNDVVPVTGATAANATRSIDIVFDVTVYSAVDSVLPACGPLAKIIST